MRLAALQRGFRAHILGQSDALAGAVADRRGLPVYANAYRVTLRDCLADCYAKTLGWLGGEAFEALAQSYIAAHQPASWTLGAYGHAFADHLAAELPDDPEAAELAWLEWRLRAAFSAAGGASPASEALMQADWETVALDLADHVAARTIASDLPAIWAAIDEERAPDTVMLAEPAGIVVWRDDLTPRFRTTSVVEAAALEAARAGQPFAALCAAMAEAHATTPADMGALLARWLADGLIIGLR